MKKTIREWSNENGCTIVGIDNKDDKVTEEEFKKLLKNNVVIEDKYYLK